MGHTGGRIDPRPWRGRCRAGYSNTGGFLHLKRGRLVKKEPKLWEFDEAPHAVQLATKVTEQKAYFAKPWHNYLGHSRFFFKKMLEVNVLIFSDQFTKNALFFKINYAEMRLKWS